MSKNTKKTLVPKLRFPEFRELGEWSYMNGDMVFDSISNKNHNSDLPVLAITQEHGAIPRDMIDYHVSVTSKSVKSYKVVEIGDFIISLRSFQGGIEYSNYKGICSPAYIILRKKTNILDLFFKQYFKTNAFIQDMNKNLEGIRDGKMVSYSQFSELLLPTPIPEEQQKIADCLSSIDELITVRAQKIDTLKAHKKGLMQQLFPAKGETVPKWRFSEFKDSGEWKEKLIEDFFDVGSSKRVLQKDWTTQGIPFYRTRELVSLSKNEPFRSEIFISENLFSKIAQKYGLPSEGDFLISGVGTLGISYQVQAGDRLYFKDGNVLWFKLKEGISSTFFKYCFESDVIQNQILGQASKSTVGTYTIKNAKITKFPCPSDTNEQQKIADFLSSIDDLITAQTQKLDALKAHKKGLMQQLFPSVDEEDA
ncbi:MAG: restriction endonuclease subunit S [Planctomycetes bacterium]|nr:restriction endonuclease subunit S [Planctomycetota bacterium]